MTRSSCPYHSGTHIFFRPGWNARHACPAREFPVTSPSSFFLQPGRSHRPAHFPFGPVNHTAQLFFLRSGQLHHLVLFFSGPVGSLRQALFSLTRWGLWWWSGRYIYARIVPPPPPSSGYPLPLSSQNFDFSGAPRRNPTKKRRCRVCIPMTNAVFCSNI